MKNKEMVRLCLMSAVVIVSAILFAVAVGVSMMPGEAQAKAAKKPVDPAAVRIELTPTDPMYEPASGRAIVNGAETPPFKKAKKKIKGESAPKSVIQVNCWGLDPETEYEVGITLVDGGPLSSLGTFVTNKKGTGALHADIPGTRAQYGFIAVSYVDGPTVLYGP
jgi:hypothetical protein